MATQPLPLPDEIRKDVRDRKYGNRAEEDKAVWTVDQAVFDRVRIHEQYLTKVADDLNARVGDDLTTASDMLTDVAELAMAVSSGEIPVDRASAKQYQQYCGAIDNAIEHLHYLRKEIEFNADKSADPYRSMSEVLAKYSSLRAGRGWDVK